MLLITQPRVGTRHNEILALQMAARDNGWDVYPAPFSWRLPEDLASTQTKGIPYGSQTFGEVIAQQMNWKLKANSHDWLARVPFKFLKRNVTFSPLKYVRGYNKKAFIKPADDKCFDAKIYDAGEFNPHEILEDNTPVLISDIVDFESEFRCYVCDNKVQTWSNYLYNGEINEERYWTNPEVYGKYGPPDLFLNEVLTEINSKPSVIDVGIIRDVGWAVIETNQAWASGLYGCELNGVLKVLEQSCEVI